MGGTTELQVDTDGGADTWTTLAELSGRFTTATLADRIVITNDPVV